MHACLMEEDFSFSSIFSMNKPHSFWVMLVNPFSASPKIGQVQKFCFRKFIPNLVFMVDISRDLFFFLEKTLNFFSYKSEETEKSSQK